MIKRKDRLDKAYLAVRGEINGRTALNHPKVAEKSSNLGEGANNE
jgi:hypothetical protein